MTRANENNSATWPDPIKNPDGWALRAKRYLCTLMNMHGALFESVIEERDRIALECIALLKDEGHFGNKSRLMAIHAREMAARAELRDGLAAQRAKEKAEVALKNEKGKQAALDTPAKDPAIDKLNDSLAALAEAEQDVSDLTPAEDTPIPPKKSALVEAPERYKIVTAAGAYFENDLTLALKMGTDLKGKVIDTQTGQHMNEPAAPAPKPAKPAKNDWITALGKREAFWAKAEENALKRGFERGDVHPIMHAACNVESMYDFPGTGTEAMELFITELETQRKENAPEPPPAAETVAEKPSANEAKNGNAQTALVPVPEIVIDFRNALTKVKAANDLVRTMRDQKLLVMGRDYGKINEKNDKEKPSLWKPGAEKLCTAFELVPKFELIGKVETWDAEKPLFHYQYRCRLYKSTGEQIAEAVGSCNSREKKYRYRKVYAKGLAELGLKHDDIPANRRVELQGNNGKYWQYTIENDEVFDLVNTIDKMAQKRALIAAVLMGTNASEYFTQDTEHMLSFGYGDAIDAEIVA